MPQYYPLTQNQLALYYKWQMNKDLMSYNMGYKITFPLSVDISRLKDTIRLISQKYPGLRTRFSIIDGEPMQWISQEEISVTEDHVDEKEIDEIIKNHIHPIDILNEPLCRYKIFITEKNIYLLHEIHHAITDGHSSCILNKSLAELYAGMDVEDESRSIIQYSQEQRISENSDIYDNQLNYFTSRLNGVEMTTLPRQLNAEYGAIGVLTSRVNTELINSFGRANGVSPNNIIATAFAICLSRIVRDNRVAFCTVHHGRVDKRYKDTVGMFVKTLPFTTIINPDISVLEQIKTIRGEMTELWQNQDIPLHQLKKKLKIEYDLLYTFQYGATSVFEFGGTNYRSQRLPASISDETLSVVINQLENEYEFSFEYNQGYYTKQYIQILLDSTLNILNNIIENPMQPCRDISMVSEKEKKLLLELSKGNKISLNTSHTLLDMFSNQVKIRPNAIAVVDEISSISYENLDKLSNALAWKLLEIGISKNQFVGVMLPRCKEFIISAMGIFKAGAAYLPLDIDYPNERLQDMIEDSQSKILITTTGFFSEKERQGNFNAESIIFIDEYFSDFDSHKYKSIQMAQPTELAYMIYTSGSTGKPKGVMIPHRALYAFINAVIYEYKLTSSDKIFCHSNFCFDASIEDLYSALAVGGEVYILGSELRQNIPAMVRYIKEKGITGGSFTTKLGAEILTQCRDFSTRYVTLGGEKLDKAIPSHSVQYNSYGPTEFTVGSTYYIVDSNCNYNNIPIGRPVPNSYGYILDKWSNLMPRGTQGELCLSGAQIACGYWRQPEKTAEVFVQNPYATDDTTKKMYRTGDLVQWNDQGLLEYVGRIDNQVKLRGFRIELGEIENAISRFDGIKASIVEVCKIGTEQHLCAYFTASHIIDIGTLKRSLKNNLTEYMVPNIYIQLEEFPMTPNGKINRKLLPIPTMSRINEYVAPTTDLQKLLCQVFSEVLDIEKIGINDNFFDIGGTSLSVIMAIVRIENLGYAINYSDFFRLKSVSSIANFIDKPNDSTDEWFDLSNYDYTAINNVLAQNNRDLWENYNENELGDILLTGPTGYLGIHVLRELLNNETGIIYCLMRKNKDLDIETRLKTLLMYYFSDTYDEYFDSRIKIVEGDITDINSLNKLCDIHIDTVINCAAIVKHYSASNEIERVNIEGVKNLIQFCKQHSALFIQTSTYSIGGVSLNESLSKDVVLKENMLYFGQTTNNKYIYSKFIAERMILQAVADGMIEAKIFRLGNLMARKEDGEFQINFSSNAFVGLLRAYKVLKTFPISRVTVTDELSPIDSVANALIRLARTPHEIVVLHPYNNNGITLGMIMNVINDYGFNIDFTSDEEFKKRYDAILADPKKSTLLSSILHLKGFSYAGSRSIKCDNDFTTKVLYRSRFHWPITGEEYIYKLIIGLDGMLFFDES